MLAAENALVEFGVENGFTSLSSEISAVHRQLRQVELQRDNLMIAQTDNAADSVRRIDGLIAQSQKELEQLEALLPEYDLLAGNLAQARSEYNQIRRRMTPFERQALRVPSSERDPIVQAARAPSKPVFDATRLLPIGLVVGLGSGILLAFSLEAVFPSRRLAMVRSGAGPGTRRASEGREEPGDYSQASQ
jgi:hypothetical protein